MLNVIKKFDAGTIRALAVATIPLLVLIASLFGVDEAVFQAKVSLWVERIAAIAAATAVAWAAWERLFKPTPPLTETAAKLTDERLKQEGKSVVDASTGATIAGVGNRQGGFGRPLFMALLAVASSSAIVACGTLFPNLKSFDERAAAGYALVTAVSESASALLEVRQQDLNKEPEGVERQKKLDAVRADFQNVYEQLERARTAIDIARTLQDVDFKTASNRLNSAIQVLEALEQYLEQEIGR